MSSVPFVAPLRIQRRTDGQLRHATSLEQSARDLLAGARGGTRELELELLRRLAGSLWRSPYYAEVLRQRHLSARDLRHFTDLAHFPTLDRATLAERWSELPALVPDESGEAKLVVVTSSGTTGEPAHVLRSERECLQMWATLRFWVALLELEMPRHPRVVLLDALPSGLTYSVRVPVLERGALHRISLTQPGAFTALRRLSPDFVFTDPAGFHALLAEQGDMPQPRLLLTSAQRFAPSERARVAERFTAPVINYYATTETGPIAWECLQAPGSFHALHPEVWVESIEGALGITRLRPSPLPLLRYLPGDRGSVEEGRCACGFIGRTIRELSGRSACDFIGPAGRVDAWQLAWAFKLEPLAAFELSQVGAERFALRGRRSDESSRRLVERLREALHRLGWSEPEVEVRAEPVEARAKPAPFTRSYEPGMASSQP